MTALTRRDVIDIAYAQRERYHVVCPHCDKATPGDQDEPKCWRCDGVLSDRDRCVHSLDRHGSCVRCGKRLYGLATVSPKP